MDGYAYILSYLSSIQPLLGYGSPKSIYSIQYLIINWIPKRLQQIHLVFWSYAEPCVSLYAHVRVQEPYATVMLGPLQWKPQSVTHRRLCHGPHGCILLAVSQSCPLWWRVTYNPFVECVSLCLEYVFLKAVYPFISPNVEQTLCMCTASLGTEHAPRGATDGSTTLRNLGVSLLCGDRPLLEQPWWQFPTMCWTCQHLGSTTYIYMFLADKFVLFIIVCLSSEWSNSPTSTMFEVMSQIFETIISNTISTSDVPTHALNSDCSMLWSAMWRFSSNSRSHQYLVSIYRLFRGNHLSIAIANNQYMFEVWIKHIKHSWTAKKIIHG